MTEKQFTEITLWAKAQFPESTVSSKLEHLEEEVKELKEAVESNSANAVYEYADCIMLLYDAMYREGMSYQQICNAIQAKFEIVQTRQWQEPDEKGVVRHRRAK